ncbi:MAG: enoyl-CoA hydratase/isomerase family protein [Pseudomonadota bacterium]
MDRQFEDVAVTVLPDHVAEVELRRPPNNFFDVALICAIADAFEWLDERDECRAIVLCAEGKHFCAGANFTDGSRETSEDRDPDAPHPLYSQAVRLFGTRKPVVAAVQGAAIGGGFGLAMAADFRTGSAASRFAANFVKLGFSPGFGLTHTLPRVVGQQAAQQLCFTGRRIDGVEAARLGVIDDLVEPGEERAEARYLAKQIAENAPLAVESVRASLRGDLLAAVRQATEHEAREQFRLQQTDDHREGIRAVAERRAGRFTRR